MTEQEWLASNAGWMLYHLEKHAVPTHRKLRLLAVAYARILETLPEYANSKHVAHLGEEVADGCRTLEELWDQRVRGWGHDGDWAIANLVLTGEAIGNKIRTHLSGIMDTSDHPDARDAYLQRHCAFLRPLVLCVLGNPFRPVAIDRDWLTSTVTALASQMYESRDFGAMPILADALQDAGCDNHDVLDHCRNPGPHARGCWVVDLVLGKS